MLAGLNPAQRQAVTVEGGPVLVIAGAGTGKTRTLVHRVAWLVERGVAPEALLLLTFTRRAAEEMLSRARAMHPACGLVVGGTFHSLCYRLLRRYGSHLGLAAGFSVIDTADSEQIIRGAVEELGLKARGERGFPKPRTIAGLISRARNLEESLEELVTREAGHLLPYLERMVEAARRYQALKREQGLVDYDDLLYLTERLLVEQPELRRELAARWRHLLVDEYQDTNAVQARLVELLGREHGNVMVVGDDAQSIYAFRGARVQNILEFPRRFPGAQVIKLEENYRSRQPILELANALIAQARAAYAKQLFTGRQEGPRPRLLRPREQRAQSRMVVERIRELLEQGVPPEEIAVLFRAARHSFDLEGELKAERIPYVKYGGLKLTELAHVKDLMAHLRVLVNPGDFLSWQRILMLIPGVGPKTARQVIAHLVEGPPEEYVGRLAGAPAAGRIAGLGELAGLLESLAAPEQRPEEMVSLALDYYQPLCERLYDDHPRRLADLEELPAVAAQYGTAAEFLAEVVLDPPEAEAGAEPRRGAITLSTVHSAKGREWAHVMVIWFTEGRLPAYPSLEDEEAVEEERRLAYVAVTRAAESLTLLAPREQYLEGSGWREAPLSRFLAELPAEVLETPAAGPVFPVAPPRARPAAGPRLHADRPFAVGTLVEHATFGRGKVMGYQGKTKVIVYFDSVGLKILVLEAAGLAPAGEN